jgi:hypothetical protein
MILLLAIATLALLVTFHVIRLVAGTCSLPVCDWYSVRTAISLSLLLLAMVVITGAVATYGASQHRPRTGWPWALGAATVLGFLGPIVSLVVFRYDPRIFFPVASGFIALVPVITLAYRFGGPHRSVSVRKTLG